MPYFATVKLRCIAIDDEPLALALIKEYIKNVPYLVLVGEYTSAVSAMEDVKELAPDILFLDINMPQLNGIEFIKLIDTQAMVIFTTAHAEHAIDGFEVDATDYLMKPFPFNRFLKATNKALETYKLKNPSVKTNSHHFTANKDSNANGCLMIKVEYSTVKLSYSDIKYIEGVKDYVKIKTDRKSYLTKSTFKNILEKLPPEIFIRVHKSYIISLYEIESIERFRIKIAEKLIPVGDFYKENFQKIISELSL